MSLPASELPLTAESKATIAVVGTNDVDQQAYGRLLGDQFQLFYWALSELRENIARQCPSVLILDEKFLEGPEQDTVQSVLAEIHGKVVTLLATSQEDTKVGGDDPINLPPNVDDYLRPPADSMRLKIQNLLNVRYREQEKEKQDDLERLFELSLDIMGVANMDGYFTRVNPAFGRILGYDKQELLAKPFLEFVHPDDREATLAEVAKLSRGEIVIHFQNRYRCKDGSYKWLAWTSYPYDGKLYAVARDVTQERNQSDLLEQRVRERTSEIEQSNRLLQLEIEKRGRIEATLEENMASFQLLFENNPLPMWVYDLETLQFLEVNEAAMMHYGYTRDEFLQMTITDIRPEEEVEKLVRHIEEPSPTLQHSGTWRHRLKDDRVIEVEISSHSLPFKGHNARLVVAKDVTEQRKLQNQLNHIQKMDAIGQFAGSIAHEFNNVLLGVQVHSEVMARAIGMDLEAPKKHEAAKPHLDELHGTIQNIVQTLGIDIDPDKKLTAILPLFPQIKESVQLLRQELLQFKTDPKNPQNATTYLDQMDQHIQEITQLMESNFENVEKVNRIAPLFLQMNKVVQVFIQFLKKQEQITNSFTQIMASAQKGKSLTSPLLTFSHKQEHTELKTLNLNRIIREWEKTFRRLVGEDIHLVLDLSEDLDNVLVDEGQMQQILMNLLSNSRDAIHSRSPDDSSRPKRITISTENIERGEDYVGTHAKVQPGLHVQLSVDDNGCGMDEETKARACEPMFTTKPKGKGTGFGLAVIYALVENLGGFMYIYTEPENGTAVKISFPIAVGQKNRSENLTSRKTEFLTGTETILVVEDEVGIRGAICDDLRTRGYHVLEARDVEHALQLSEEHRGDIDLALIDWVQPRMSGKSLSEKLCLLRPRLKTLFISGYTQSALGSDIRPEIFLSKPFTTDALAKKLREMLDVPRKKRILLIEDEGVVAGVVGEALQAAGYEVILVGDGASALTEHQQHIGQIDLVLADLGLPGNITGRDMIRQLLEQDPNLKIVACSGEGAVSIPGIMGTIAKPYSLDGLVEEVGIILPAEETAKE